MTAEDVLQTVATLPRAEWLKIQSGIAEMLATELSAGEIAEIRAALREADEEFARGEFLSGSALRKHLGIE